MTSKIKVDNINKVSDDSNIINKCGTDITMGQNGDTVIIPNGVTEQVQSGGAIQVQSGGSLTIASGATITNNGTAVGLGRTGTVDWATTPVTATFTAANGVGYFANTSGGAFNMNLPAGVAGAIVSVADYAATFQTTNLTVVPNGTDKIGSLNQNAILGTEGQSVTFVFVDSTQGWINTMDSTSNVRGNPPFISATISGACNTLVTAPCCANTKIATFTGPGNFCVSGVSGCAANNVVSYMVVAGGASGGYIGAGGGGGAGGFREYKSPVTPYTASPLDGNPGGTGITVSAQNYPITVGAGGTPCGGSPTCCSPAQQGSNSIFSTIISTGGGGGGKRANPGAVGLPGGSGGGSGGNEGSTWSGGSGNTPPVSPSQGKDGGSKPTTGPYASSGGGGATVAGTNASSSPSPPSATGAPGGAGASSSISSGSVNYSGGGGGASRNEPGEGGTTGAPGGAGGGGQGAGTQGNAVNGTANLGGGGGGGGYNIPGSSGAGGGGSGVVIIRYKFQ